MLTNEVNKTRNTSKVINIWFVCAVPSPGAPGCAEDGTVADAPEVVPPPGPPGCPAEDPDPELVAPTAPPPGVTITGEPLPTVSSLAK